MAITFRDEKGAPLTHEELDANFRSFFFTASFSENNLSLQRKDGVTINVPVGGQAFADFQENGGSIGDVFIADSQITGSRMIIDLFNGQFYDKTKAPNSAGGGLTSDEWYIDFDPASTAPYYVHFGPNFAISSSGYMFASGARLEGDVTASSGLIAGFGITPDAIHGPLTLGTPNFFISGAASNTDHFISASNFSLKGSGDITGSAVLFSGGTIAGWTITNSEIRKSSNIVLDATNESISIKSSTFGNQGIQLQHNSGTPRFYVGDGASSFAKFDGTDVSISTKLLEISASNIEISSTHASMSLGGGSVKLLGASSAIEVGTANKFKISGSAEDAMIVAGTKTGFATNDAGLILGMDAAVPTLDLTKDASNYLRFNTTSGIDIKTDTFKLDTTNFDIDTSTKRLTIFKPSGQEIIRLGEISNAAGDLFGLKIYDGAGTGSSNTIAQFGQQGNKVGGWEITGDQIRSIPAAGFGGSYAEGETGLIINSSGTIESSNFVTNVKGWRIDTLGNGSAEFENMRIRGTLKTTVFEKESVNVVGGQLMVTNASTIQPLRSAEGTIIAGSSSYAANAVTLSLANVSGFETGEILKVKTVDDTGFGVEYLYVSGTKRYSEDNALSYNTGSIDPDGLAGEIYVERGFGGTPAVSSSITTVSSSIDTASETTIEVVSSTGLNLQDIIKIDNERLKVTAINNKVLTVIRGYHDSVADSHTVGDTIFKIDTDKEFLSGLVSAARPLNEGQVILSTGVFNPATDVSSGYIMMNANPRDISTPYMDIVERTGSGVYDLELRSRLGDLSGLSSGYLYGNNEPGFGLYTENGFFKGAITADTGSIAGILHVATVAGGLETGQKISIGRDVSGTNDGIFVNNNNYWYTDGAWKVGGADNFISLDNFTDGNLTIKTETFSLDTSNFMISSSLNNGTLTAGANASSITTTSGTGVYIDGNGKFRVGTATSGNNYIYWDGSTLNIKGAIDITGGTGATTAELNAATASLSGSLATEISSSDASLSSSIATTTNTIDSKIFTDSSGRAVRPPTASAQGLYMTSTNLGFYKGGEWATYMDNEGDFFLTGSAGNKLAWDSSAGTLEIKGSINITGGNAATQTFASSSAAEAYTSASADIDNVSSSLSSSISSSTATLQDGLDSANNVIAGKTSIFRQNNPPSTSGRTVGDMWIDADDNNKVYVWNGSSFAATPDGTYDQTVLINTTSASLSSSVALDIFTDSSGKLVQTPDTSSADAQGLFLGDTNLGFYSGSQWRTYMANNGNFFLTGSDGQFLSWDGGQLTIQGSINIVSGNAATTSSVASAQTAAQNFAATAAANAVTSGSNAAATAQANALAATNAATASLSSSLSASIAQTDATALTVSASHAATADAFDGVVSGKNSVFRQNDAPSTSGRTQGDMWIDDNDGNRLYIFSGSTWVTASDATFDQAALITSTSASFAATIFTDSSGKIVSTPSTTAAGLYLGDSALGFYNGSKFATFMSNNGSFFLTGSGTNKLAWDGTSLIISGDINVLGGNAATQDYVTGSVNDGTAALSASLSGAIQSNTAAADQASDLATTASAQAAQAVANSDTAITRSVDNTGKITFNPTPSGTGLFMSANNLGYYDTDKWKAYLSSSGEFFLTGSGNSGLVWDGTDLSIDGSIIARDGSIGGIELDATKMYIGSGNHNNADTKFYTDNTGKFSLGNALSWDGTTLTISGSVTVTNENDFASQAELQTVINATSSLANPDSYSFGPSGQPGFALAAITGSITGPGLFFDSEKLGFHSGNNGTFLTYMDKDGNFYLSGSGDQGLAWDGNRLIIGNKGLGPSLTYQFSGSLDSSTFVSDNGTGALATATLTTPVLGNRFNNNNDSHDAGFHSDAFFARSDSPIFEFDVVAGSTNPGTAIGLYKETPSSFGRSQMSHAVYMHHNGQFRIYENGSEIRTQQQLMGTTSAQWTNDTDFSDNQQFRIRIRLLPTGARYTVFKNGNFITPLFVYDSITNGVTEDFVRPGAGFFYSSTSQQVLFQAMAGGHSLGNTTKIAGDMIQTGLIKSNNHSGNTNGNAFTSAGTAIDLDGGALTSTHFRITNYGAAVFKGELSAATGNFVGSLQIGSGNAIFKASPTSGIQLGHASFASAPFSVTPAGVLKATSGTIGGITLGTSKIYIGTGTHNNSNTKFYADNTGKFSLGSKLSWNGTTLSISGDINIEGGNAATTAALNSATASLSSSINESQILAANLSLTSNLELVGRSVRKIANDNSWNGEMKSLHGQAGSAEVIFRVTNVASARRFMMGLNTDPSTNTSFTSIDHAWYINGTTSQIYQNGNSIQTYESISNGDVFKICYDGATIKYYHNNTLKRTESNQSATTTYYLDSSFFDVTNDPILDWFDFSAGSGVNANFDDGFVGGWTIDSDAIFSGTKNTSGFNTGTGITLNSAGSIHSKGFFISQSGDAQFKGLVQGSGITGSLIAGTSIVGGNIEGGSVIGGNISVPTAASPKFSVNSEGIMTAEDAAITGEITATSGRIGDWVIDQTTNALRDDNSEIIFEPNIPEIQMFSGAEKKVIISPLDELTPIADTTTNVNVGSIPSSGGNWSTLTSTTSVSNPTYGVIGSSALSGLATASIQGPDASSNTFTADAKGTFEVTLNVPAFTVKRPSVSATGTTANPSYNASYNNQTHGKITPRKAFLGADLYLCAFNSSNTEIGSVLLAQAHKFGNSSQYNYSQASGTSSGNSSGGYSSGGSSSSPLDFLIAFESVDENSLVTLGNGDKTLAKNLQEGDELKVWDYTQNKFVTDKISKVKKSTRAEYYEVEVDGKAIKVSSGHEFWMENGEALKVEEVNPGFTEIFIDTGNGIEKKLVTKRDLIKEELNVVSLKIPPHVNYIANEIIHHNTATFTWNNSVSFAASTGAQSNAAAQNNKKVLLTISESGTIKLRYKWLLKSSSARNHSTNASGITSYTESHFSVSNQSQTFDSVGSFDTQVQVKLPTNFVELKAGGLQVVSGADKFIKAVRQDAGITGKQTIFQVKGGNLLSDDLLPNTNSTSTSTGFDLGGSGNRWRNLIVYRIFARDNITAFTTSTSSDIRLKENIRPITGALDKVLNLQGVSFDWKDKERGSSIGFIAQDFEKQLPELTYTDTTNNLDDNIDDVKTIDYSATVAVLTEAIKELTAKVNELEKKLESKN